MSLDITEVEIVVFDAGGFRFGAELSQIISVVKSEERKGQKAENRRHYSLRSMFPNQALEPPRTRGSEQTGYKGVGPQESISLVDLSKQLEIGRRTPAEAGQRERGSEEASTRSHAPSLVLLVNTGAHAGAGVTGVHVDSLRGIVKMPLEQIEPLPEFLKGRVQTDCIWGIGKLEQELIILLDIDRYLSRIEAGGVKSRSYTGNS